MKQSTLLFFLSMFFYTASFALEPKTKDFNKLIDTKEKTVHAGDSVSQVQKSPVNLEQPVRYGDYIMLRDRAALGSLFASSEILYSHLGSDQGPIVAITPQAQVQESYSNHLWIVRSAAGTAANYLAGEQVKKGDIIRLQHFVTGRYLSAGNYPAPANLPANEVTLTQSETDLATNWIVQEVTFSADQTIVPEKSGIRLLHLTTDRLLASAENIDVTLGNRFPVCVQVVGSARRRNMGVLFFVVSSFVD